MPKAKAQVSRQARWQRKHRAMGLCALCSQPVFRGWRCKRHYELHQVKERLRHPAKVRGRYRDVTDRMLRDRLKELEASSARKAARPRRSRSRKRAG
jgi:hypothetical protein